MKKLPFFHKKYATDNTYKKVTIQLCYFFNEMEKGLKEREKEYDVKKKYIFCGRGEEKLFVR